MMTMMMKIIIAVTQSIYKIRTSKFCMEVYLDNIEQIMMMVIMMMIMIMAVFMDTGIIVRSQLRTKSSMDAASLTFDFRKVGK